MTAGLQTELSTMSTDWLWAIDEYWTQFIIWAIWALETNSIWKEMLHPA
jgi:hypothetical protein